MTDGEQTVLAEVKAFLDVVDDYETLCMWHIKLSAIAVRAMRLPTPQEYLDVVEVRSAVQDKIRRHARWPVAHGVYLTVTEGDNRHG